MFFIKKRYPSVFSGFIAIVLIASPGVPAAQPNQPMESLPTPIHGTHEQRMTAVLAWLEEDAALADASKLPEMASARRADLATLNSNRPQESHPSRMDDLLPPIIHWEGNPVVADFFKKLQLKVLSSDKRFPKGPEGGKARTAEGWAFIVRAGELMALTQALCHPQSPLTGDPALVAPILRRLAFFSEYMVPGGPVLGDFGPCATIADAYLILRSCRPEIIPPSIRDGMENGIRNNADAILAKSKAWFENPPPVNCLVNSDVHLVEAIAIANRLQPTPTYAAGIQAGLKYIEPHILADGASNYIGLQNECPSYHGIAVDSLARTFQITGDPKPAEMLKRMRWYYPLTVSPTGVMEWASAPDWHHYWNMVNGADAAAIMAEFTDCPHNQRVANLGFTGDLWMASWWNPDRKAAPWPDRYTAYDRNVEGPRGRYGLWSFVGTTRRTGDDNRGKSSYVGCVIETGKNDSRGWPVSAALQDAGMEVRLDESKDDAGEHRGRLTMANEEMASASAVSQTAAALGAVTSLGTYGHPAMPWITQQAWLFTPERIVGIVRLESGADQKAAGVFGDLFLVSGRGSWGERKEIKDLGDGSFGYGDLVVTFHAHDFAGFDYEYAEAMGNSPLHHSGENKLKSCRLLLVDDAAKSGVITDYKIGASHFYLVEVRPAASAPATVSRLENKELLSFSVKDGTGTYRVAFNPGTKSVRWNIGQEGILHRTGEKNRPDWLKEAGSVESVQEIAAPGVFEIPAGEVAFVSAVSTT